jgi:hypothetical protein
MDCGSSFGKEFILIHLHIQFAMSIVPTTCYPLHLRAHWPQVEAYWQVIDDTREKDKPIAAWLEVLEDAHQQPYVSGCGGLPLSVYIECLTVAVHSQVSNNSVGRDYVWAEKDALALYLALVQFAACIDGKAYVTRIFRTAAVGWSFHLCSVVTSGEEHSLELDVYVWRCLAAQFCNCSKLEHASEYVERLEKLQSVATEHTLQCARLAIHFALKDFDCQHLQVYRKLCGVVRRLVVMDNNQWPVLADLEGQVRKSQRRLASYHDITD